MYLQSLIFSWLLKQVNTSSLDIVVMKSFVFIFSYCLCAVKESSQIKVEGPSGMENKERYPSKSVPRYQVTRYTPIFIFWPNLSETRNLLISLSFTESNTTEDYCNFDFWITQTIGLRLLNFSLNSACILDSILFQFNNCQQCSRQYNPVNFLQSLVWVSLASSFFCLLVHCQFADPQQTANQWSFSLKLEPSRLCSASFLLGTGFQAFTLMPFFNESSPVYFPPSPAVGTRTEEGECYAQSCSTYSHNSWLLCLGQQECS